MRDFRYEETSVCKNKKSERVKYMVVFILSIFSWAMAPVSALFFINVEVIKDNLLANIAFFIVVVLFFIASALFLGRLKFRFNVDYDYTIITGSVRINKVMNNVKNAEIAEFDPADIIKIGRTDDQDFLRISETPDLDEIIATSNVKKDTVAYYIFVPIKSRKAVVILDCTEKFIANLAPYVKRDVITIGTI